MNLLQLSLVVLQCTHMHVSQPECFIILMGLRENPFKPSEVATEELAIQSQKNVYSASCATGLITSCCKEHLGLCSTRQWEVTGGGGVCVPFRSKVQFNSISEDHTL